MRGVLSCPQVFWFRRKPEVPFDRSWKGCTFQLEVPKDLVSHRHCADCKPKVPYLLRETWQSQPPVPFAKSGLLRFIVIPRTRGQICDKRSLIPVHYSLYSISTEVRSEMYALRICSNKARLKYLKNESASGRPFVFHIMENGCPLLASRHQDYYWKYFTLLQNE